MEIGVQFLQGKNRAVISFEYQAVYGVWAGHLQPWSAPTPVSFVLRVKLPGTQGSTFLL